VPTEVVPAQLPPALAAFAGRAADLERLDDLLAATAAGGSAVIGAVSGSAGVGKTAMAVYWAHRVAPHFPDGQLYVNLRGYDPGGAALDPAEAVRGFLGALGVPGSRVPADLDAQSALYRSVLAGRRVLVVLDNARDADQVRPLLPAAPGCLALVTSRDRLTPLVAAEGAVPLGLNVLSTVDARRLLVARLGERRTAEHPDAVEEIITRCARLPLALAIAAARAAQRPDFPVTVVAGELDRARDGLDGFTGGDAATDVRTVFSWSYRSLTGDAARLFRLLGLHPGADVGLRAAASLLGVPVAQARRALDELTRVSLLVEHAPGRYGCHDLLRAYAAELTTRYDTAAERGQCLRRVVDHYLRAAYTGSLLLRPTRRRVDLGPTCAGVAVEQLADRDRALDWYAAERQVLLSLVEATLDGLEFQQWQLAWSLLIFLGEQGYDRDNLRVQEAGLGAAQRAADLTGQAYGHRGLGWAHARLGDMARSEAHSREALRLFEQLGDGPAIADVHINLSSVAGARGEFEQALHHAERAQALSDSGTGGACAEIYVSWYHGRLGDYQRGLGHARAALVTMTELGETSGVAGAWNAMGVLHFGAGDPERGTDCLRQAIALYRRLGHRFLEADSWVDLGDGHERAGDGEAARDCWERALELLDALGHDRAVALRSRLATVPAPATPASTGGR
jgi:tetratricopeptide (TPR) repeat protein